MLWKRRLLPLLLQPEVAARAAVLQLQQEPQPVDLADLAVAVPDFPLDSTTRSSTTRRTAIPADMSYRPTNPTSRPQSSSPTRS